MLRILNFMHSAVGSHGYYTYKINTVSALPQTANHPPKKRFFFLSDWIDT